MYRGNIKPKIAGVLLVLGMALLGCGTKPPAKEQARQRISLEKTGCLRGCLTYKIQVSSSGHAELEGFDNIPQIGKYSRQLSKQENESLWKLVNADTLNNLMESYNYGDEDTQQQFLKYYANEKLVKEIKYGPFPPGYLQKLDKALQKIALVEGWMKMEKE